MIETDRLVLTPPAVVDYADYRAMLTDAEVMRYIGAAVATPEEAWNKLLRAVGHWTAFGYGLFTVRERATGAYVGEVGLAHFARGLGERFDPFPEAAWVLARAGHGRGYATEAARIAHDWLLAQSPVIRGTGRTVALIHPDNAASLRIAAKLGYHPFGETAYRGAMPLMLEREP